MKHLFQTAVAAAAMAVTAPSALASTTANASIGPLTIRLVDLDTSDSVTPWITFRATMGGESNAGVDVLVPDGSGYSVDLSDVLPWSPLVANAAAGGAVAQASISGNGTATGSSFSASGSVNSLNSLGAAFNARAYTPANAGNFLVSANTLVLISANASIAASMEGGSGTSVNALSYLDISGAGSLGSGTQTSYDGLEISLDVVRDGNNLQDAQTRKLSVSFVNLLATETTATFRLATHANSWHVQSPVPEPETYALMLAGLAAIGLMARRRRS